LISTFFEETKLTPPKKTKAAMAEASTKKATEKTNIFFTKLCFLPAIFDILAAISSKLLASGFCQLSFTSSSSISSIPE